MIRGVVFDLDGTLLDTEKLYRRFWVEAARQMGYPMEDRHALMIRSMAAEKAERLLRREVCAEFDYHAVRALRTVMIPDQDEPDEETAALCTLITPTLSGIIPFIRKENELNKHKL